MQRQIQELQRLEQALPENVSTATIMRELQERKKHLIPIKPTDILAKYTSTSKRVWSLISKLKPSMVRDKSGGLMFSAIIATDIYDREPNDYDYDTSGVLALMQHVPWEIFKSVFDHGLTQVGGTEQDLNEMLNLRSKLTMKD